MVREEERAAAQDEARSPIGHRGRAEICQHAVEPQRTARRQDQRRRRADAIAHGGVQRRHAEHQRIDAVPAFLGIGDDDGAFIAGDAGEAQAAIRGEGENALHEIEC